MRHPQRGTHHAEWQHIKVGDDVRTARVGLARVPVARSRLWLTAAQIAQAELAGNGPEGRWEAGLTLDQRGDR